jgi:hypothetical protein
MISQISLMPLPDQIVPGIRLPPGGITGTIIPEDDDAPLPGERRPPRPGVPPRLPPGPPAGRVPKTPPTGPGRGIN